MDNFNLPPVTGDVKTIAIWAVALVLIEAIRAFTKKKTDGGF